MAIQTNELPDFNREETYSIVMLLLFVYKDHPRYSTMSELSTILDHDNFVKFIRYYEGQTIQVPTIEEISKSLKALMMYQYYDVEKMSWEEALCLAGFNREDGKTARRLLAAFRQSIKKYRIGGLSDDQ